MVFVRKMSVKQVHEVTKCDEELEGRMQGLRSDEPDDSIPLSCIPMHHFKRRRIEVCLVAPHVL